MLNWLKGKKTYLVSAASIIYALAYYGWDKGNWSAAVNFVLAGAGGVSMRAAIAKVEARLLR